MTFFKNKWWGGGEDWSWYRKELCVLGWKRSQSRLRDLLNRSAKIACLLFTEETATEEGDKERPNLRRNNSNNPGTAQVGAISKAQKIEGGAFWRQKKFAKKSHSAETTRKGDPSLSSGSVGYVKKVKNQRGILWRQSNFQKKLHSAEKKLEGVLRRNTNTNTTELNQIIRQFRVAVAS